MHRCLISFGANIGDAKATVLYAAKLLQEMLSKGDSVELSRLYQTPPVGGPSGQSPFINAVAAVRTSLSPWEVWHVIRSIEHQLGRERQRRWEARRIDLDILLYDEQLIWTPQLKIPHPRMCMRQFILKPAIDVAADWIDPASSMSIETLSKRLQAGPSKLLLVGPSNMPLEKTALKAIQDQGTVSRFNEARAEQSRAEQNRTEESRAGYQEVELASSPNRSIVIADLGEFSSAFASVSNPNPKQLERLAFVWVSSVEGSAWEDQHHDLAVQLRFCEPNPRRPAIQHWPIDGPRYLLATSDLAWAAHEIAAALDAMDCVVEVAE